MLAETVRLGGAALGRIVVQSAPEHLAAPDVPVVAGIGQVLVPNLIHVLAWGHRCLRHQRQEAEPSVFLDRLSGVIKRP